MHRFIAVTMIALFLTTVSGAGSEGTIKDFTLKDMSGKEHSLSDYAESKAIVLMFIATQCPVSNAYNERMESLFEDYKKRGVIFLGINSNKQESIEEIIEHAEENGLGFPILKDHDNVIADELEASVTPEIYVMTGTRELLYHGRIDDSQRETKITSSDLREALEAILAGKAVENARTKAFGCTIKRVS